MRLMEGSGESQGLCTSCSAGEAPAEVSVIASLFHILWILYLKSVLVQAAVQVSLASRSVASAVPPTPSPGWDTLRVPRLLQTLVALGPCVYLDRTGSASH